MAAQIGLGADIIMAFDECTEYPAMRTRTRASMEMTLRWAERSKRYFEEHKSEVPWGSHQPSAISHQVTAIGEPRSPTMQRVEPRLAAQTRASGPRHISWMESYPGAVRHRARRDGFGAAERIRGADD